MRTAAATAPQHDDHGGSDCDPFVRIPGLFRRWELEAVLTPGVEYRIEEQGRDAAGTKLFAVYRRESQDDEVTL